MAPEMRNPGWRAGASGNSPGGQSFHVQSATAEPLLQRLERVQKSGNGWRARCPACGGTSAKLTVTERDGRVLLHCFGGCRAIDVLESVGLGWPDIMPPRHWPENPEERRQRRQAMREAGVAVAVDALAVEALVIRLASQQLHRWEPLSEQDDDRLALACHRIELASEAMTPRRENWRPVAAFDEAGLVSMRRAAVRKLRSELDGAEVALRDAEVAFEAFKKRKEASR